MHVAAESEVVVVHERGPRSAVSGHRIEPIDIPKVAERRAQAYGIDRAVVGSRHGVGGDDRWIGSVEAAEGTGQKVGLAFFLFTIGRHGDPDRNRIAALTVWIRRPEVASH